MNHDLNLREIALLVLCALIGGIGFSKVKQPAILGYILCGIILGPSGFKLIESRDSVTFLSELGIIFLMFVVGFELRISYIRDVWKLALGCTIAQISIALIVVTCLSFVFKWPTTHILLLGFVTALSSTSAAVKILETLGQMRSDNGQRAIAILIAQDLAIVPMILILENSQYGHFSIMIILKLIFLMGLIGGVIFFLSARGSISLPFSKLVFKDKELVTLTSFAVCLAMAWLSELIGLSGALGAFIAGLFLGNTEQHKVLLDTIKPVQTLLLMVFFLSVGLLIDVSYVWNHLTLFIVLLLLVTVGKSIINIAILHALKLSWSDAFFVGMLLAQIGEFSILLVKTGKKLKILMGEEEIQIIGLSVLSLSFSPVWLKFGKRLKTLANVNIVSLRTVIDYLIGRNTYQFLNRMRFWKYFQRQKYRIEPKLQIKDNENDVDED